MHRMKVVRALLALMMVSSPASAGAPPPSPAKVAAKPSAPKDSVSRDGWPETHEGAIARRWVVAFSAGDSTMRAFLARDMTPESLAKRGLEERMATYRENRERFGRLMLASVVKSIPGELTVKLMASDGSVKDYVFTVETRPPYQLVSVGRMEQQTHMGHGGFGGFHH